MKTKLARSRFMAALLAVSMLCSLIPTVALAGQENGYHDPAKNWMQSSGRTNELDVNAVVTTETFYCNVCNQYTPFTLWRTPEYTRDGKTAMSRNIRYSDGTFEGGSGQGDILDGVPGVDAYYTGYHWSKDACTVCGNPNSRADPDEYYYCKNLYKLYDCAEKFMMDLEPETSCEMTDDTYHTVTTTGGQYCIFCYGTNYTSSCVLEKHTLDTDILPQPANGRYALVNHCEDCDYIDYDYVAAKIVAADYYGTVDGQAHTITISDLSDSGVNAKIRYGTDANSCTLTSAPNYTEAGSYPVYYDITYTYRNTEMEENGVAYVVLYDSPTTCSGSGNSGCSCGCSETNCGCADSNSNCNGDCCTDKGCGDNHNYVFWDSVEATCTSLGYDLYQCTECGRIEKRNYTAATEHNYSLLDSVEATCLDLGYDRYLCVDCGEIENRNYTAALGHDWESIVIRDATCEVEGKTLKICRRCGAFEEVYTDKGEHQYETSTVEATCTSPGYTVKECSICGDRHIENITAALAHNYVAYVTEPTCTEGGNTLYRCDGCGSSFTGDHTDALGHDWDEGTVIKDATCAEYGLTQFQCQRCGITKLEKNEDTLTLIHSAESTTATNVSAAASSGHIAGDAATCTTPQTCVVCGAVLVNALGHNYWSEVTKPTCTTMGYTTNVCLNCRDTYKDDYTDALGHNYQEQVTAPTCTEAGYSTFTCTRCGDSFITNYREATGHNWDAGTKIVESTCNGKGMTEYRCLNCGETRLESESSTGHTPGTAATCTAPQLCTVCGAVLENAKGHHFESKVTDPTCTGMGFTTYTCADCGLSYRTDYVEPLNHDYSVKVTEPTCTEMGYSTYTCTRCGDTYTADVTDALDHDWDEGTVIKDATCTDSGIIHYQCQRCQVTKLVEIASTADTIHSGTDTSTTSNTSTSSGTANNTNSTTSTASANGHIAGVAATCTTPQTCVICGAILAEATGHHYADTVTAPTCTTMGYTTHVCPDCGDTYKDDYTDMLGHDYQAEVTAPTCMGSGYTTYTCSRCGDSFITNYKDPTGHDWDSGTAIVKSTCNGEGMTEYRCLNCGETRLESESATGHTPGAAATCTTPQLCTVCGAVLNNALGHRFTAEITAPTCTEMGFTTFSCENCDLSYRTDYTKLLGHDYKSTITAPTCTEIGFSTYVCVRCNDTYTADVTEPLGHDWDEGTVVVNAACNSEGMTEYRCERCNAHRLESESPVGHTPGNEATCTEPQLCTVCGAILANALGHDYLSTVIAPTCTEMGYTTYLCSRCKDTYKGDYTDPTGHQSSDWIIDEEATPQAEGSKHRECEVCGKILETAAIEKIYYSATTDTKGEAVVGEYLVIVSDTATENPVSNAVITLDKNNALSVRLPDGRLLDYSNRTTITVKLVEDESVVSGMTVSATDENANYSDGITDKAGQLTVPNTSGTTNENGKATVGYEDADGNLSTLTVKVEQTETGRVVEDAVVSIGKTGNVNVTLPDGIDLDANHRITVLVTDNEAEPKNNITVNVKNDIGKSESGKTNKDGKVTLPTVVSEYTNASGTAEVGQYTVVVTDSAKNPIEKALVTLVVGTDGAKDSFTVLLPDGRLLDANDQTIITVYKADASPASGLNVSVLDNKNNNAAKDTDSNGQITVPDDTGTNGETIGKNTGDDTSNTSRVEVTDMEDIPIQGVDIAVDQDGAVSIQLPSDFSFENDGSIKVTVTDNAGNAKAGVPVTVTDGADVTANGTTDSKGKVTLPSIVSEYHSAYILGFSDGTFGPEKAMTRAQAAAIFARLLAAKNGDTIPTTAKTGFDDIPANAWYSGYVQYLNRLQVVYGKDGSSFAPNEPITRAEFIAVAVRFFDAYGEGNAEIMNQYSGFTDVPGSYWAAKYIEDAVNRGWIEGYNDGSFQADSPITRAAVVTIVNRLLGREADEDYIADNRKTVVTFSDMSTEHWAYYTVLEAANAHTATISQNVEKWNK